MNKESNMALDNILSIIKEDMKKNKITQKKLAIALGIDRTTLFRFFKKDTEMPLGIFLQICKLLCYDLIRPNYVPKSHIREIINNL